MKKPFVYLVVFVCAFVLSSFDTTTANGIPLYGAQKKQSYTDLKTEQFIREVFADEADNILKDKQSKRYVMIAGFLQRVEISNLPEYHKKKIKLLSTVGIVTDYNPNLKMDLIFNPDAFNPLKYNFAMSSKKPQVYRFDNTDYIIVINPIK